MLTFRVNIADTGIQAAKLFINASLIKKDVKYDFIKGKYK